MPYTVAVEVVPQRLLAATRGHTTLADLPQAIRPLFDAVYEYLGQAAIPHLGLNFILYYPDGDGFDFECGVEVAAPFKSAGKVRCLETPAGRAAVTTHFGVYEAMPEAHAAIHAWCAAQGETLAGINWEAYDHWHDDPAQRRTDVYYLLR
jgi:effector-binding domain-containing protein